MKIPINLASQPFRRDRAMLAASIAVSVMLVATLGVLISLELKDREASAGVRRQVNAINRQIQKAVVEQRQLDTVLRKPENAEVMELSAFLNTLLERKAISWTRIFADLEKVVPYNVKVIQIRPSVDKQDQVSLDLLVGSDSPEPMVDLMKAMQASTLFPLVEIKMMQSPTQGEPIYKYRVSVDYAQKL